MSLLFLVCLGDAAGHVIIMGTCSPNLHNQPWTVSSVVKHILIVTIKGQEFKSAKRQMFFCPKLNHRSPCRLPEKSPLYEDCTRSPYKVLEDSLESRRTSVILGLLHKDSLGTP